MAMTDNLARPWSPTDDASLSLIVSLLRDDAREFAAASKGKQAAGTLTDAELALQVYAQELDEATMYLSDRRMVRSIQSAVQVDGNALLESQRLERVAQNDRRIAMNLAGERSGQSSDFRTVIDSGPSADELALLERLTATYLIQDDHSDDDLIYLGGESSSWAASRKPKTQQRRACVACSEETHPMSLARAPCSHEYCRPCLQQLFRSAISDESLFPPRCCRQSIPVDDNRILLGNEIVQQFRQKAIEYATPNRTYCHRPACSQFIPVSRIRGSVAHCAACLATTCTTCKRNSHSGDCPFDEELQRVLQIARQEGWQRCRNCSTMVELNTGCFHITCKCRAEFCYLCGATWKTCLCPQWEEARLYNRAQQVYNRDHIPANRAAVAVVGAGAVIPPAPAQHDYNQGILIRRIMDNLRANHECTHERWRSRAGPHECEECGSELPVFIYECRQCNVMACRRCRFNRL